MYVHLFKLDKRKKCPACGWKTGRIFVIAETKEEAERMYREEGIGMCGECLCELLAERKYKIINGKNS